MLPFYRLRAHITASATTFPDYGLELLPALISAQLQEYARAVPEQAAVQYLDAAATVPILRLGAADLPAIVLIGSVRAAAPLGAWTTLAWARYLAHTPALLAELGVSWWFIPALDNRPLADNLAESGASAATSLRVALAPWLGAITADLPLLPVLIKCLLELAPQATLVFDEIPVGGAALLTTLPKTVQQSTEFARQIDLLNLPPDFGGALGPLTMALAPACYSLLAAAPLSSYDQFRQTTVPETALWAVLRQLTAAGLVAGGIATPRLLDYQRRESDRTLITTPRPALVAQAVRLWREWFAFGRTILDLVGPALAQANRVELGQAQAAVAGGDLIVATGLGWPAEEPMPAWPVTLAESFVHDHGVRVARLGRLAVLYDVLVALQAQLGTTGPTEVLTAHERVMALYDRWLDELMVVSDWRLPERAQAIQAQLTALFFAIPTELL